MFTKTIAIACLIASVKAFAFTKDHAAGKLRRSTRVFSDASPTETASETASEAAPPAAAVAVPSKPVFDPKQEAGVSGPFGFFDPLGICPPDRENFMKYRESEIKHGRVAMIAFLGLFFGEAGINLLGDSVSGPAIFQFQQTDAVLNAFTQNVLGLALAIEGFNIVIGWEEPQDTFSKSAGVAALKPNYTPGDLKFDPLDFKPTNPDALKKMQTKELNNGRLAMLGVAGIVAQELVTSSSVF